MYICFHALESLQHSFYLFVRFIFVVVFFFAFIFYTSKSHLNYCPKDLGLQLSCVDISIPSYKHFFMFKQFSYANFHAKETQYKKKYV